MLRKSFFFSVFLSTCLSVAAKYVWPQRRTFAERRGSLANETPTKPKKRFFLIASWVEERDGKGRSGKTGIVTRRETQT